MVSSPIPGLRFSDERMKKRLLKIGAAALLLAVAGAAWAPWTISTPSLRAGLADETARLTGLKLSGGARMAVALLPRPHVKIEHARLADQAGAVTAEIEVLKIDLRLLSMLTGRLEPAGASLFNPAFHVDLDRSFAAAGAMAALLAGKGRDNAGGDDLALGAVTVTDGRAIVARASIGFETQIENISATLDWRRAQAPAALNGSFLWRGERADLSFWVNRPVDALTGTASAATLRVAGPAVDLSWDGRLSVDTQLTMNGRAVASAPSLRRLSHVMGAPLPLPGPLGAASLRSEMTYGAKGLSLPGLALTLDDTSYEGSLNLRVEDRRPVLSGTLATKLLVADSWSAALPSWRGGDGAWSREVFDWSEERGADLDLRVSAARIRAGALQFDETAFSILLRAGRMELTLAEAQGYRGVIKARATIMPAQGGLEARGSITMTRVDSAALFGKALGLTRFSGRATGQFAFEATGGSMAQMMRGLDGRGQASLRGGEISGVDLEQALRRLDKRPLAMAIDVRNGRTTFDTAQAAVKIAGGQAEIGPGTVSGPGVQIAFSGAANVGDRTVLIRADASQTGGEKLASPPRLPLEFVGSWDEPRLVADTLTLLRRSGAAAPLLPSP